MGYDDNEAAPYAGVPLTTMHQPFNLLGEKAINLLIDRIEGRGPARPVKTAINATLVVRDSCGAK